MEEKRWATLRRPLAAITQALSAGISELKIPEAERTNLMEWEYLGSVPNPWGRIPLSDGGKNLVPQVKEYMARVKRVAEKRDCVSRRHHYVPQSYLRGWSIDKKRIRVLQIRNGMDKVIGIKDVCVKENFYQVTGHDDKLHNQVEAILAVFDDEMSTLLGKLRSWQPGEDFEFGDFMSLAIVLSLQRSRTPLMRRFISTQIDWMEKRAHQPKQETTSDLFVDLMFSSIYDAADEFSTRQMEIWDDPQGRFITCDHPVQLSNDQTQAPPSLTSSEYVYWPIGPTRMIAFNIESQGHKIVHRTAKRRDIEAVRKTYIRGAEAAIITTPADPNVPTGAVLKKRQQLQIDCWPVDKKERKCKFRLGLDFGAETIDRVCDPICALKPK
jgi:hypothetical protein